MARLRESRVARLRESAVERVNVSSAEQATLGTDGLAVAPAVAPAAVRAVIAAGNAIATSPYRWGGGHGGWLDRGYDCSGSVSYALHGAGLLDSPLVSGALARWGQPGPGR